MRGIFPWLVLLGLGAVLYLGAPDLAAPPAETFGERAKRLCAIEASPSARDQKDCVDRKLVVKALEMQNEAHKRALH